MRTTRIPGATSWQRFTRQASTISRSWRLAMSHAGGAYRIPMGKRSLCCSSPTRRRKEPDRDSHGIALTAEYPAVAALARWPVLAIAAGAGLVLLLTSIRNGKTGFLIAVPRPRVDNELVTITRSRRGESAAFAGDFSCDASHATGTASKKGPQRRPTTPRPA